MTERLPFSNGKKKKKKKEFKIKLRTCTKRKSALKTACHRNQNENIFKERVMKKSHITVIKKND